MEQLNAGHKNIFVNYLKTQKFISHTWAGRRRYGFGEGVGGAGRVGEADAGTVVDVADDGGVLLRGALGSLDLLRRLGVLLLQKHVHRLLLHLLPLLGLDLPPLLRLADPLLLGDLLLYSLPPELEHLQPVLVPPGQRPLPRRPEARLPQRSQLTVATLNLNKEINFKLKSKIFCV